MLRHRLVLLTAGFTFLVGEPSAAEKGRLIYADGNQITGQLASATVFVADRFGVVRFDPAEARFAADQSADQSGDQPQAAGRLAVAQPSVVSPAVVPPATPTKPWWHPWKFAVNGYIDRTLEKGEPRHTYHGSFRVDRPVFTNGHVSFEASYEYRTIASQLDQRRATTQGEYRHRFAGSRWFALYQPKFEYDGRNLSPEQMVEYGSARINYLISQHAVGGGYVLLDRPRLQSNAVLSWNHLDIEVYDLGSYATGMPSFDLEHLLTLRGGFEVKQQGRVYWIYQRGNFAWENRLELSKRVSEHLLLTLRHEYRQKFPLRDANPLDRLRLLFGLEY